MAQLRRDRPGDIRKSHGRIVWHKWSAAARALDQNERQRRAFFLRELVPADKRMVAVLYGDIVRDPHFGDPCPHFPGGEGELEPVGQVNVKWRYDRDCKRKEKGDQKRLGGSSVLPRSRHQKPPD